MFSLSLFFFLSGTVFILAISGSRVTFSSLLEKFKRYSFCYSSSLWYLFCDSDSYSFNVSFSFSVFRYHFKALLNFLQRLWFCSSSDFIFASKLYYSGRPYHSFSLLESRRLVGLSWGFLISSAACHCCLGLWYREFLS